MTNKMKVWIGAALVSVTAACGGVSDDEPAQDVSELRGDGWQARLERTVTAEGEHLYTETQLDDGTLVVQELEVDANGGLISVDQLTWAGIGDPRRLLLDGAALRGWTMQHASGGGPGIAGIEGDPAGVITVRSPFFILAGPGGSDPRI